MLVLMGCGVSLALAHTYSISLKGHKSGLNSNSNQIEIWWEATFKTYAAELIYGVGGIKI